MSAAASRLELESPISERSNSLDLNGKLEGEKDGDEDVEEATLAKLTSISPPSSSGPVIAVDLDDVLSQTNHVVAQCKAFTFRGIYFVMAALNTIQGIMNNSGPGWTSRCFIVSTQRFVLLDANE